MSKLKVFEYGYINAREEHVFGEIVAKDYDDAYSILEEDYDFYGVTKLEENRDANEEESKGYEDL